jgi:hypothetical protein
METFETVFVVMLYLLPVFLLVMVLTLIADICEKWWPK